MKIQAVLIVIQYVIDKNVKNVGSSVCLRVDGIQEKDMAVRGRIAPERRTQRSGSIKSVKPGVTTEVSRLK